MGICESLWQLYKAVLKTSLNILRFIMATAALFPYKDPLEYNKRIWVSQPVNKGTVQIP